MSKCTRILITGATGFVGINLVKRLIEQDSLHLYLLVRDSENESAETRIINLLKKHFSEEKCLSIMQKIDVLKGDITESNLGLTNEKWDELSHKVDSIIHSAATIHFNLPYEEAHEINVKGTQRLLDFAMKCYENNKSLIFNHISTAYVAGKANVVFSEKDINIGQEFGNTYEQTKCEAELLVQSYADKGLPVIVYRPSIISGDFSTGEITKSNLIFEFMYQLNNKIFKDFICDVDSSLNIIPIDYFLDTFLYIMKSSDNPGKTFNIVSKKNVNIRDLLSICSKELNIDVPNFVQLSERKTASKMTRLALLTFTHYIEISHAFDDSSTAEALAGTGIVCPNITDEYILKIISFCKKNNFI